MKDADGDKYYTDKEKCNLMEKSWKSIFRITEEEVNFDKNHSNHINNYINIQHKKSPLFLRSTYKDLQTIIYTQGK